MHDPLADDMREGCAAYVNVIHIAKRHRCAILCQPHKQRLRVVDRNAGGGSVARFRAQVQDNLYPILRAQLHGREVLRCVETWRVPLDTLGYAWINAENDLPERENLWLKWVIKRREKGLNVLRRGGTALG